MNSSIFVLALVLSFHSAFASTLDYDPSSVVVRSTVIVEQNKTECGSAKGKSRDRHRNFRTSKSDLFKLDTRSFVVPSIQPFEVNDFGMIQIAALEDDKLKGCDTKENDRSRGRSNEKLEGLKKKECDIAGIRMYTIGTPGPGLWNAVDHYGIPILAGQSESDLSVVGLNPEGAATLQTISLSNHQDSVSLEDFTNPKYHVYVDFSDAGAGDYDTTLVVEYFLAAHSE